MLAFLRLQRGIWGCLEWSALGGITKSLGNAARQRCCLLKQVSAGTPPGPLEG